MSKLLIIFLLLISVPIGVYLVTHPTFFKSKAAQNGGVRLYRPDGSTITDNTTKYRFIYLEVQKPDWSYGLSPSLVKTALAQIDTNVTYPVLSHDLGSEAVPGTAFRVYWSNISKPHQQKIGLFRYSAPDDQYESGQWLYISSCNQTLNENTNPVAGSCPATLPANLNLGTYQLRMFTTEPSGLVLVVATSPTFNIVSSISTPTSPVPTTIPITPVVPTAPATDTSGISMSISPNPIVLSNKFTLSWQGIPNPTVLDWVGLYRIGDGDDKYFSFVYTSSCTKDHPGVSPLSQGSCEFTAGPQGGNFEYRLFKNNSWEKLSTLKFQVGSDTSSLPDSQAYTQKIRISLDPSAVKPDGICNDTIVYQSVGQAQVPVPNNAYCREINATDSDILKRISWVLPENSGDYTIYVGFISNTGGFRTTTGQIRYNAPSGDPTNGVAFSAGLISVQVFLGQVSGVLRQVPGTSAINAGIELITRVHQTGEQIITLSQAKQIGIPIKLDYDADGLPELVLDKNTLASIGLSADFYPEPDPITNESRIILYPAPVPLIENETSEVLFETAVGESAGRALSKIAQSAVKRFRYGKSANAFNEQTVIDLPNKAPVPIKNADITDLIVSNNPEAIGVKLNAKYLGEAGSFGWGYKSNTDGSFIKIYQRPPLQSDIYQKDFYAAKGGTGEVAKFLGEIRDSSNNLVGFKQEFIEGVQLDIFLTADQQFTKAEIRDAVSRFAATTRQIGHAHGDLVRFGKGWEQKANFLHAGNIKVQSIIGADGKIFHKIKFIDWGGFDMTVRAASIENLTVTDALKSMVFIDNEIEFLNHNLLKYAY